jgi:hypothetical protein
MSISLPGQNAMSQLKLEKEISISHRYILNQACHMTLTRGRCWQYKTDAAFSNDGPLFAFF